MVYQTRMLGVKFGHDPDDLLSYALLWCTLVWKAGGVQGETQSARAVVRLQGTSDGQCDV